MSESHSPLQVAQAVRTASHCLYPGLAIAYSKTCGCMQFHPSFVHVRLLPSCGIVPSHRPAVPSRHLPFCRVRSLVRNTSSCHLLY